MTARENDGSALRDAATAVATRAQEARVARRSPAEGETLSDPRSPDPRHRGRTYIEDDVVSVIARIAAERIEGVHQLGNSSLRGMMSRFVRTRGVESEVGLKEAAIDLEIVVEFGYPIREVAEELRAEVIQTIEATTGRRVIEVNVFVVDVHIPRLEHRSRRVE